MQKWEFAELGYDYNGGYHYLILFKTSGSEVLDLKRDKNLGDKTNADARRRMMAQLGLQGWELVSSHAGSPYVETLYFKRPLP